jgi:hypothetical protein
MAEEERLVRKRELHALTGVARENADISPAAERLVYRERDACPKPLPYLEKKRLEGSQDRARSSAVEGMAHRHGFSMSATHRFLPGEAPGALHRSPRWPKGR